MGMTWCNSKHLYNGQTDCSTTLVHHTHSEEWVFVHNRLLKKFIVSKTQILLTQLTYGSFITHPCTKHVSSFVRISIAESHTLAIIKKGKKKVEMVRILQSLIAEETDQLACLFSYTKELTDPSWVGPVLGQQFPFSLASRRWKSKYTE